MLRSLSLLVLTLVTIPLYAQSDNSSLTRLHPRPQVSWLRNEGSFFIRPNTRIIVSDSASPGTLRAVQYLQKLVKQEIGDTLLVLRESENDKMEAMYIGTRSDFPTLAHLARLTMTDSESLERAESYVLDVQSMTTLVLGSDSNGVFDAISTFAQFFIGPSLQTSVPALHILDWPDYPVRWVFSMHNLQVASQVDALAQIEDTMAYHKLNGLQQDDFKYNRLDAVPSWYFTNVDSLHRHSDRTNVEIIPGVAPIGYSEGILLHDPDLAEGFETNARFVSQGDSGRLLTDPTVELANGGFEAHNGDSFVGYGYQDAPGQRTFADNTVYHSGSTSMKCANMTGGNTRVIKTITCKPHRGYHLSVWAKTSGFSGYFQILAIGVNDKGVSQTLTFTQYAVPSMGDWMQYNVVFNTLGNSQINVYAGIWGDAKGTIWLDDFAIEDAGLTNILRRPMTKPTVTVLHKSASYAEGRDYAPLVDSVMERAMGSYPWHASPTFVIPRGSTIQYGDTINVHFWRANPVLNDADGSGSTMVCVSEDTLYSILREQISRVERLHHPKQYMMGHDEIRAMNQDSACLSRDLSPAALLADNLRKCDSIIHDVNPKAPTYVWSDMFDSLHNAHANYYLVNGDLSGDWDLIPKDVTIVNWNGTKAASLEFFAKKGFRQISSPYYDVPNTQNMRDWRIAMEGVRNVGGMMYTTWSADYSYLTPFADYAWSAGPMIVHQPFDSVSRAAMSAYEYLPITAYAYPDPYDPADSIVTVTYRELEKINGSDRVREAVMQKEGGGSYTTVSDLQADPGEPMWYEIEAKNSYGITRKTPRYFLFKMPGQNSVPEQPQQSLRLFPNPAADVVYLDVPAAGKKECRVFDVLGHEVLAYNGERDVLDVHMLPAGSYTVEIISGNERHMSSFVVRR